MQTTKHQLFIRLSDSSQQFRTVFQRSRHSRIVLQISRTVSCTSVSRWWLNSCGPMATTDYMMLQSRKSGIKCHRTFFSILHIRVRVVLRLWYNFEDCLLGHCLNNSLRESFGLRIFAHSDAMSKFETGPFFLMTKLCESGIQKLTEIKHAQVPAYR